MTETTSPAQQAETPDERREFERERLMVWALDSIAELMAAQDKSKADIARILGTSRAHITQLFRGDGNVTLRTLADLAFACDSRVLITAEPLRAAEFVASPVCVLEPSCSIQYVSVEHDGPAQAAEEAETDSYALAA